MLTVDSAVPPPRHEVVQAEHVDDDRLHARACVQRGRERIVVLRESLRQFTNALRAPQKQATPCRTSVDDTAVRKTGSGKRR